MAMEQGIANLEAHQPALHPRLRHLHRRVRDYIFAHIVIASNPIVVSVASAGEQFRDQTEGVVQDASKSLTLAGILNNRSILDLSLTRTLLAVVGDQFLRHIRNHHFSCQDHDGNAGSVLQGRARHFC